MKRVIGLAILLVSLLGISQGVTIERDENGLLKVYRLQLGAYPEESTALVIQSQALESGFTPVNIVNENGYYKVQAGEYPDYLTVKETQSLHTSAWKGCFVVIKEISETEKVSLGIEEKNHLYEEDMERAVQRRSEGPDELWEKGLLAWKSAETVDDAIECFACLAQKYPAHEKSQKARVNLGNLYASRAYRMKIKGTGDPQSQYRNLLSSACLMKEYLKKNPNASDVAAVQEKLGKIKYSLSRYRGASRQNINEAIEQIDLALGNTLGSDSATYFRMEKAAYLLELARNKQATYDTVINEINKAEKESSGARDKVKARLQLMRAEVYVETNNMDLAEYVADNLVSRYTTLNSEKATAQFIQGYCIMQSQHFRIAIPMFASVLKDYDSQEDPLIKLTQREALLCKGICEYKIGEEDQSKETLKSVIEKYPNMKESVVAQRYLDHMQ